MFQSELPHLTDIVIIGAGFAGAATAYHLRKTTRLEMVILEKEEAVGVHSSGRNAAIVREYADEELLQPLLSDGAAELRAGRLTSYFRRGNLLVGLGDEDVASHFGRATGKGRWCPEDGVADAAQLLQSYLEPVPTMLNVGVVGFDRTDSGMLVRTTAGEIRCRIVVNAAGPWAGEVGHLPLNPLNRHLFQTPPMDWVDPDWPTVWDKFEGFYFRPESGGVLLSACDEIPAAPGDYREDPSVLESLSDKVSRLQPGLGDIAIQNSWAGQRVFAPDRLPVIGFDPRNDRLFHVAGLGGHGLTFSYSVGRLAAVLIAGGSVAGMAALSAGRFAL